MKELYEFDQVKAPEEWVNNALTINRKSSNRKNEKNKIGCRRKRISTILIAAAIMLVLFGTGTMTFKAMGLFDMSPKEKEVNEKPFIVLLTGADDIGNIKENSRSDANLLVAVNPNTKKISIVFTPREAYVSFTSDVQQNVSGDEVEAQTGETQYDKLNFSGVLGTDRTRMILQDLYGVTIDNYTKVNFSGVKDIVDALGGITVDSDVAFTCSADASEIPYAFEKGSNQLDGSMALAFCRERQAFQDGDEQRGENQMKVIEAVLNKMMSMETLSGYEQITDAISSMMTTDMTKETIVALIKGQANSLADWSYETYITTGQRTTAKCSLSGFETSVVLLDTQSIKNATQRLESNQNGE